MVKFRNVVLFLFGFLLLSAFAVETATQIYTNSRTVDSWSSLVSKYLEFREQYGPIVPPSISYEDIYARLQADDFSFLAKPSSWQFKFDGGNYYVDESSKLAKVKTPLHILILEDIQRSEIIVLSSTDGKKYQGEAVFSAPEFTDTSYMSKLNLTAEERVEEQKLYAFEELAPRRVIWHVLLKSVKDALPDLVSSRETLSAQSVSLLKIDGMMMSMSAPPPEHTNDLWLGIDGTNVTVFAPDGFTNRVEIYSTDNLISNDWNVAVQNLLPVHTNPAAWDATSTLTTRFLRAGNMDIDSDGDGLPDAREQIVYKTDPNSLDSDGDAVSDGDEVLIYGLDPNDSDTDDDGLSDSGEVALIASTNNYGAEGVLIHVPSNGWYHVIEPSLTMISLGE